MTIRLIAFFIWVLAAPVAAFSDELLVNETGTFTNWGVGAMTCDKYVEARELPDSPIGPYDATFRQWMMGFTTAFNIQDPSTADLLGRTSVERAMKWIEDYCRKNGDEDFLAAVWKFTKMAYPHRVKSTVNLAEN